MSKLNRTDFGFNLMTKPRRLLDWLEAHGRDVSDRTIVVFVDGADVFWAGCTDWEERFKSVSKGRVVFAAEMGCDIHVPTPPGCEGIPDPPPPRDPASAALRKRMLEHVECSRSDLPAPCSKPPMYKFLNSGTFAGRKGAVVRMLKAVNAYTREQLLNVNHEEDDQAALTRYWLENRRRVVLDYEGRLFLSLFRIRNTSLRWSSPSPASRAVSPAWADRDSRACFLHDNGNGVTVCDAPKASAATAASSSKRSHSAVWTQAGGGKVFGKCSGPGSHLKTFFDPTPNRKGSAHRPRPWSILDAL